MKRKNKPVLEQISPEFGSSFTIKQYFDSEQNFNIPFWHVHPELELVYVNGGSGKRHVGHHLSYYRDGDLILIGSNLPHYGFTDRLTSNQSETVIQMKSDFLGRHFFQLPEMGDIYQLFERAKGGISFYGQTKKIIGPRLEHLPKQDSFGRLLELLAILREMAVSEEYQILNAKGFLLEVEQQDNDRVNEIYNFVRNHFREKITLEEIASKVNMTVPGFCRYFKKISGKTFTRFVNEFRVVHACKLLQEEHSSITEICFESGFNNFSHFSRLFKDITNKSPSAYRKDAKMVLRED